MKSSNIVLWVLLSFQVVFPSYEVAIGGTGYDGAGNYIEDTVINEKVNRKFTKDRLEKKRQEIIKNIKKDPKNHIYHYYLGSIYLEMKQPLNAIVSFKEVVKLNPENGKAYYQLAKAFSRINDTSKAIRYISMATQIFEQNFDLHWQTKADVFLLQLRDQ